MLHLLLLGHSNSLVLELEIGLDAGGCQSTHVEVLESLPVCHMRVRLLPTCIPPLPDVFIRSHILEHQLIHAHREADQGQRDSDRVDEERQVQGLKSLLTLCQDCFLFFLR